MPLSENVNRARPAAAAFLGQYTVCCDELSGRGAIGERRLGEGPKGRPHLTGAIGPLGISCALQSL
jgi:hypothetical protein